jgi:hypothetical protein
VTESSRSGAGDARDGLAAAFPPWNCHTHTHTRPHKPAGKKKAQDPFTRKDWYDIKAPTSFNVRNMGKTLVTRTTGTKVCAES